MSFETILYQAQDRVAVITLNRPEVLNAFGPTTMGELVRALHMAEDDPAVGCLVLTGAGRGFCSGADVRSFQRIIEEGRPMDSAAPASEDVPSLIFNLKKPTIVAVNGPAVGLGATLPLPFDIRIASEQARFGYIFARVGLIPEFGSTFLLSRIVGLAKAMELVLTARIIDAQEALGIGLVNRVVPHERLMEETLALAGAIARGPTRTLALAKEAVHRGLTVDLVAAQRTEGEFLEVCRRSPEHREGVHAFLEKREPQFVEVARGEGTQK